MTDVKPRRKGPGADCKHRSPKYVCGLNWCPNCGALQIPERSREWRLPAIAIATNS